MFYKLVKKVFVFIINLLQFLQVSLIFIAFFVLFYWILQLWGVRFAPQIAMFFEGIKDFINIFYTRTVTIDGTTIDFSFLFAALLILFIAWGLKFIIESINFIEKKYDDIHFRVKKQREKIFNVKLNQEYLNQEYKNNKFLVLISFEVENFKTDKFFSKDFGEERVYEPKEILEDFFEIIESNLECKEKFLEDGLLLYFDDFNKIDENIINIESIISSLKSKYKEKHYKINYFAGIETYADKSEISSKTERLIKIVKLMFKNEIVCLSTFKQRYSLVKEPKHTFEVQGIYKIIEDEEIFCLKKLK